MPGRGLINHSSRAYLATRDMLYIRGYCHFVVPVILCTGRIKRRRVKRGWHVTKLLPEFRQVHSKSKEGQYIGSNFREYGMSLGPQQILQASNIAVIVSGERKQKLFQELLSNRDFDPQFPLSVIHHSAVTDRVRVYATPDAVQPDQTTANPM